MECQPCLSRHMRSSSLLLRTRRSVGFRRIHQSTTRQAEDQRQRADNDGESGDDAMARGRKLLQEMDDARRNRDLTAERVPTTSLVQPHPLTSSNRSSASQQSSPAAPTSPTASSSSPSSSTSSPSSIIQPKPPAALSPAVLQAQAQAQLKQLQGHLSLARATLTSRAQTFGSKAETEFGKLGGRINEVTGYREVERLKDEVVKRETEIARLREVAKSAKEAYDQAVSARASSQKDVAALLERKHTWNDTDVSNFTSLVRSDHSTSLAVSTTKTALVAAELAVEGAFDALMKSILERYHEEQVWSDKIRSVSTYGSLVVLVANLVVFVGAVVIVEPWKRRRLVEGLEMRMTGMLEGLKSGLTGELEDLRALIAEHGPSATGAPLLTGVLDGPGVPEVLDPAANAFGAESPSDSQETLFSLDISDSLDIPSSQGTLIDSSIPASPGFTTLNYLISSLVSTAPFISRIIPRDANDQAMVVTGVGGFLGGMVLSGLLGLAVVKLR